MIVHNDKVFDIKLDHSHIWYTLYVYENGIVCKRHELYSDTTTFYDNHKLNGRPNSLDQFIAHETFLYLKYKTIFSSIVLEIPFISDLV